MSATTGFDVSALAALVNETEFGFMFYKEALMNNDTFAFTQKYGEVLQNAKNDTYKLGNFNGSATAQDGDGCGQNSVDQITHTQTTLTMVNIKFEGQFCPQTLEPYYLAAALPPGQHYESLGALGAQYIAEIQRQIAKKMAIMPYYGPTGADTATYANGPWMDLLLAQTGINLATGDSTNGGSAGTDAAGAWNRVEAIKNRFLADGDSAAGVFEDGEYSVEMSPLDASLYFENMRTLFGQDTVTPLQQRFNDGNFSSWIHPGTRMRIYVVNALGSGDLASRPIIGTRRENKVLAFDLRSDTTRLEMGMDQYREFIWWKWRAKMGTAWRSYNTKDVAYFGPAS